MFGYVRLFLASVVMVSHLGFTWGGINPGMLAVLCFYMLAGFVVTHLLTTVFPKRIEMLHLFYIERFLRIYPLYIFMLLLTVVFLVATDFGKPSFSWGSMVGHLLIIPLNYHMYVDSSVLQEPRSLLMPTAWSLGAELQAYLLLPFVVMSARIKITLACLSLCVFLLANTSLLRSDYFGFRLIPGLLFIFILGSCVYKTTHTPAQADRFDRFFPPVCYMVCIGALAEMVWIRQLNEPYLPEVFLGILFGLPAISYIASKQWRLPLDRIFGNLSYGVFLSHPLCIWAFTHFFQGADRQQPGGVAFVFSLSVVLALIGTYSVEKPVITLRQQLSRARESKRPSNGINAETPDLHQSRG